MPFFNMFAHAHILNENLAVFKRFPYKETPKQRLRGIQDSLHYLSLEGMLRATGIPADQFSTAAFTGIYPIDIGKREQEVVYSFR
jgi:hypothetical protein